MDFAAIVLIQVLYAVASLALISVGLAIIFGMMKVINFAHGEFLMLGGYAVILPVQAGVNLWIAMLIIAPVSVGLFGMIVERLIIRPLYGRVIETVLATWGLSLFLIGAASTKDFSDIEGDRAGGCKTLPIVYGPKRAAQISAPFFVLPWVMLPLGVVLRNPWQPEHAILTGNPIVLSVLGTALAIWGAYTAWLMLRDPDELSRTENHPSWTHMYLMMLGAQIGFALAYMV